MAVNFNWGPFVGHHAKLGGDSSSWIPVQAVRTKQLKRPEGFLAVAHVWSATIPLQRAHPASGFEKGRKLQHGRGP